MKRILILTEAEDVHAIAVAEALALKGAHATLWATSDFPTRAEETVHFTESGLSLKIQGPEIRLEDPSFDVVWRRRPAYVLDPALLHPADRAFAESECGLFRRSIIHLLAPQAFWVNPPAHAARASSKMLQHAVAREVGLRMPETLYTNSPGEVRAFLSRTGSVIYKPLLPTAWSAENRRFVPYTSRITDPSLIDETLRLTPGIFQEQTPKRHEIRLTVMGRRCFAAKIEPKAGATARLDWRQAPDELQFEPAILPREIEMKCFDLLEALGLVFGCFDFIVTPDGSYVFLEVNEMGQFLFVERCCDLPLLDAFTSFLMQGKSDFEWQEESGAPRYNDPLFSRRVAERIEAFAKDHVAIPERLVDEAQS